MGECIMRLMSDYIYLLQYLNYQQNQTLISHVPPRIKEKVGEKKDVEGKSEKTMANL